MKKPPDNNIIKMSGRRAMETRPCMLDNRQSWLDTPGAIPW